MQTEKQFQESNVIQGDLELQTQPTDLPVISPKAGWTTSQGQLTAIFTVISLLLSMVGWAYSPEQIANVYQLIMMIVTVIGPLVPAAWNLMNYTNSRGKIYSNAINASGAISTATALSGGFDLGSIGKIIKGVSGSGIIPGKTGEIIGSVFGQDNQDITNSQILEAIKNLDSRVRKLENQ